MTAISADNVSSPPHSFQHAALLPRLSVLLLALGLLWSSFLHAQNHNPPLSATEGHGLFIGIGKFDYQTGLKPLVYAPDDAVLLAHLFVVEWRWLKPQHTKLALGGAPKSKTCQRQLTELKRLGVKTVSPTHRSLEKALQETAQSTRSGSPLIITFSGHGYQGPGNIYLMPVNGNWQLIKSTGISSEFLTACLQSSPAGHKLLLLDACSTWIEGRKGDAEREHQLFQQQLQPVKNLTVLASCLPGERSWQSDKLEHGIFTKLVHEEMDQQGDALKTWSPAEWKSLSDHSSQAIHTWLQSAKWGTQTPWFFTTVNETK